MSSSDSDDGYYGPALPPGFQQKSATATAPNTELAKPSVNATIGPTLPPELRARLESNASHEDNVPDDDTPQRAKDDGSGLSNTGQYLENQQVNDSDSESDTEVIGPLPPDHPMAAHRHETGSSHAKPSSKPQKREEWMLVPPKNKIIPGLGLEPRKFLTRTPQDSKKSDDEEDDDEAFAREADAEIERKLIDDYDSKMDEMKKDFETRKRRGESLLQIHQKEIKEKKNKSDVKVERKTFDRDTDLTISGMSKADQQKYIEKSKELNTKFSRGSRKYL